MKLFKRKNNSLHYIDMRNSYLSSEQIVSSEIERERKYDTAEPIILWIIIWAIVLAIFALIAGLAHNLGM